MLSREDNALRVERGTPMGTALRRYWIPALLARELPEPDGAPVRVRLLGKNLVAFRDTRGQVGLLDEFCPHRRASLFFGRNEECGLRCVYHGWKFDTAGCGIGSWSGSCLRMADYVTVMGAPRGGDRRRRGLVLPSLSARGPRWPT